MALPGKSAEEIAVLNARERERYFMEFARFAEDAPRHPYAIRVGSKTVFADDTMDLRKRFEREVANLKRRMKRWEVRGKKERHNHVV